MFGFLKASRQRKKIRQDRICLEARARRFLKAYLAADSVRKQRFYEAVEGASAACHPGIADSTAEDAQIAESTAAAALKVVRARDERGADVGDSTAGFITDAYATVAIAYRRAAGAYIMETDLQKLGTAAVHLLTMATSYLTANPPEGEQQPHR
ncbi:hypothetical protein ACVWYQ_004368 [Bradyrhizobium sp. USDA 3397]